MIAAFIAIAALAQLPGPEVRRAWPLGIFDSGTGGLTVMEAILTMDEYNNVTGAPGADGRPDFQAESFQYLADQANMPYGNYAAEGKTDLLKEHILKNMNFLLNNRYAVKSGTSFQPQMKVPVKMMVVACNTATAYALPEIKAYAARMRDSAFPVVGVIDAGSKAALQFQQKHKGTIGVFATAGTVASGGYPRTLEAMAGAYRLKNLSIVSQGGAGLAESIDRDWSFLADTATAPRPAYKGPSLKNKNYPIDTSLLGIYKFDQRFNRLLCEYDDKGRCADIQLNDPANYVRYHLVSLLEKMRVQKTALPLNTLILGCTHYPYMRDTIRQVLKELYDYTENGKFRYRPYLAAQVELIDPAVETAREAYQVMTAARLKADGSKRPFDPKFFIAVPNTLLREVELQPDGWFTYDYKYGREAGRYKTYVQYVPFDRQNVPAATYDRFRQVLPAVSGLLDRAVRY